jgi:Transposase IS116/IS110/IS902 family
MSTPPSHATQAREGLDKPIDDLEVEISNAHAQNEMTRSLYKVPGIGKIIASVIAASVPDPSVFKSGRDFAAWLGLTPRQTQAAVISRTLPLRENRLRQSQPRQLLQKGSAATSARHLCATARGEVSLQSFRVFRRAADPMTVPSDRLGRAGFSIDFARDGFSAPHRMIR